MFLTEPSLSEPYSDGCSKEPNRRGDLVIDSDNKANPQIALDDLKLLCLKFLPETFGIDPWDMQFYCSGSKGFHAVIPARFFGLEAGDPFLPLIYGKMVKKWAAELKLTSIDHSMYAMKRGKMFRLANVKRPNGRYKVPLTRDDIAWCALDVLWSLSNAPREA